MASGSSRRGGRPPTHFFQTTADSLTADVSLYPSQDGTRLVRDTTSRHRKRKHIGPESLDDDFAHWSPGIDTQVGRDGTEYGESEPTSSGVVVNLDTAHRRVRYLSSVCIFIYFHPTPVSYFRTSNPITGLSYAHLEARARHGIPTRVSSPGRSRRPSTQSHLLNL